MLIVRDKIGEEIEILRDILTMVRREDDGYSHPLTRLSHLSLIGDEIEEMIEMCEEENIPPHIITSHITWDTLTQLWEYITHYGDMGEYDYDEDDRWWDRLDYIRIRLYSYTIGEEI